MPAGEDWNQLSMCSELERRIDMLQSQTSFMNLSQSPCKGNCDPAERGTSRGSEDV